MPLPNSLRARVLLLVLPVATLLMVLVAWVTSSAIQTETERSLDVKLEDQAKLYAQNQSATLRNLFEISGSIASNSLIVNGLIDTQSREQYLVPFFRSLQIPGPNGVRIALVDYKGRLISANDKSGTEYTETEWIYLVLSGSRHFEASASGMTLATPVMFDGNPEGAIVVQYTPAQAKEFFANDHSAGAQAVLSNGEVVYSSNDSFARTGDAFEEAQADHWIFNRQAMDQGDAFEVIIAEERAIAFALVDNLYNLNIAAVGLCLLALFGGLWLATELSIRPVRRISKQLGEIANDQTANRRVATNGAVELQNLAQSFNKVFATLEETSVSLDQLTAEIKTRKLAEQDARANRSHLMAAIESIPEAFALFDAEDRLSVFNRRFTAVFERCQEMIKEGNSYEAILKEAAKKGHFLDAEGRAHKFVRELMDHHANPQEPIEVALNDGAWLRIQERRTDDGSTVGIFTDITALKNREQSLALHARELKRSNMELEQFAQITSHDLQEPLRKIQAFGDRLFNKYSEELPEEALFFVTRMHSSAARMQALIQDLLILSRVSSKANPFEPVDLDEAAKDVLSDFDLLLQETGGKIEVSGLPSIEAEARQMRQLLSNMLNNALKFRKPDTAPIVSVVGRQITDTTGNISCEIKITDNGIGFEQRLANKIFEIFQRLHARESYDGTGIGLAICKRIVDRHKGHISVVSAPGEGTEFTIILPGRQTKEQNVEAA